MPSVMVPLPELIKAATFIKMKRMPKGVQGDFAKDTILGFHRDCLIVEAPTNVTMIKISGGFECRLSVNAKGLNLILGQIPKKDTVTLGYSKKEKSLIIGSDGTEVKLPAEELR